MVIKMSKQNWERSKTSRIYLHPPLAERIVVMYPDFKVTDSSLLDNGTHLDQPGIGLVLLHGENMDSFDYTETKFSPVTDGLPIYTVNSSCDGCDVAMEAFCDFERVPTTYFRVTVTNASPYHNDGCLGALCRSGKDTYMVQNHMEGYAPYKPNVKCWYMLKRTWQNTGENTASDGRATMVVKAHDGVAMRWVEDGPKGHMYEAADYFRFDYSLEPHESVSFDMAICSGGADGGKSISADDYDTARAATVAGWQDILSDICVYPDYDNKFYRDVYLQLATQCMQMLARYEASELVATRQGDLGRFVWPFEATLVLEFLDHIGLRRYTREAYRYFCERWFTPDGDDKGRVKSNCAAWENFTGSTLWGMAEHLRYNTGDDEFEYFLPYMMDMLDWIERRRHTKSSGYAGIFPSGQGSDWSDIAQFWTFTDSYNLRAINSFAEILEMRNHQDTSRVRAIYNDYKQRLIEIRDELYRGHETDESFLFPHELGLSIEDSQNYSFTTDGGPILLVCGIIEPGSRMMEQMENYFVSRGMFDHGLTGVLTSCAGAWDGAYHGGYGDVWYTMQSDSFWVSAWLACGQREKAKRTLDALMYYGLTTEHVVSERYCSIDEWYTPWQPNGSGSARLGTMLLQYYGEKKTR